MDSLVKNSRTASETAVAAANSYKNIVSEIDKSLDAAKQASTAAEDTINKVTHVAIKIVLLRLLICDNFNTLTTVLNYSSRRCVLVKRARRESKFSRPKFH